MAGFTPQPDEGYSEDPLTAQSASTSSSVKPREDAVSALASARSGDEFPSWLVQHISGLSTPRKTELVMALLNDLPTSVIAQVVNNLYPRLYIDFVRYLPPEVCLKILGYLDPISLINVARCCRAWHDLALDRKLWQQLYYLEGWKAREDEIALAEHEVNEPSSSHGASRRAHSEDYGHAHKKRAIALASILDPDMDMVMADAEPSIQQEPSEMETTSASIFGDPRAVTPKAGVSQHRDGLGMQRASSGSTWKGKGVDRGKPAAPSPERTGAPRVDGVLQIDVTPPRLDRSTLWLWDAPSRRFKINWKHLYSMRRRLESNWEKAKYTNFQFPHPNHPEEGHGECVYCLQFDSRYLVSGSRDKTIKVWDMKTRRCLRTLEKHRGSVLCLQFDPDPDEDLIVSGSSDSDVIIWKFSTGREIQTLKHAHRESVLNVKFDKRILVTCSKDKTIKVFNRKPLRHGDLGYREVDPVGITVKDYGYNLPMTPDDFPVIPAWTMIGCLEGHGAAVNAVQIHDREVVSASGDRHIKVWDWPTQVCTRTVVGHAKGIACVQYDGRRIVSGSSDNEVKIFDRQTGLEVANLRSHTALVRTVQAGFADLPHSVEDDLAEAQKVDQEYLRALESGLLEERDRQRSGRRQGNAGSRRPQDICAYGAKIPPGGGGGKYGRIVSGSYDATIIVWRRDKEGVWKDQHHFKQEDAAHAALRQERAQPHIAIHPSAQNLISRDGGGGSGVITGTGQSTTNPSLPGRAQDTPETTARSQPSPAPPVAATGPTLPPPSTFALQLGQPQGPRPSVLSNQQFQQVHQVIDDAIQSGQQAFERALSTHPAILNHRSYVDASIDRLENPLVRSQLRQAFSGALIRAQLDQARQRREAIRNQEALNAAAGPSSASAGPSLPQSSMDAGPSNPRPTGPSHHIVPQLTTAQLAAAEAHHAHAHVPHRANLQQVLSFAPAPAPASGGPAPGLVTTTAQHHQHHIVPTAHTTTPVPAPAPAPAQPPQAHQHHPHIAQAPMEVHDPANAARVFKLQYDARRIICCSQRSVIVGWDFCNGDPELEEASRFFGHVD
ncbi:hypothetical protein VTK26DRAFT_298 [Humicola hyalothermophila]